jgi:hypothetical protein
MSQPDLSQWETANVARREVSWRQLVTPTSIFRWIDDYGTVSVLKPNVSRCRLESDVVRENPERFRPVVQNDRETRNELRQMANRLGRRTADINSPYRPRSKPSWHLGTSWRLS